MASFTREFVTCSESDMKSDWSCIGPAAFFCAFCRHDFALGDEYRMVYTNDIPRYGGNPLTCKKCWHVHGGFEGLRYKWKQLWDEYRDRFKYWAVRG